jgi:hypothetical protein
MAAWSGISYGTEVVGSDSDWNVTLSGQPMAVPAAPSAITSRHGETLCVSPFITKDHQTRIYRTHRGIIVGRVQFSKNRPSHPAMVVFMVQTVQ